MLLSDPISLLKGIGKVSQGRLNESGIYTVGDLLSHYPCEYRDMRRPTPIGELASGEYACVAAKVIKISKVYWRGAHKSVFRIKLKDSTGELSLCYFNQGYLYDRFNNGDEVYIYGRAMDGKSGLEMTNPQLIGEKDRGMVIPVYRLPAGIKQKTFREAAVSALEGAYIEDEIPREIRERYGILEKRDMLKGLHMPVDSEIKDICAAHASLREMMDYELSLRTLRGRKAAAMQMDDIVLEGYISHLAFSPTDAQLWAMREIAEDMSKSDAMNRLLQGDVGSGKTCVAFFAAYLCMHNNGQTALMAPTEILAEQHYKNACAIFGERCALLTGRTPKRERDRIERCIASGEISLIIGTHALLYSKMKYNKLVLVITDEQHRFGVSQRAALEEGEDVHTLVMSATPIPRTLSLILYGEAGVSILDALPSGRKEVKTSIIAGGRRGDMYRWIKGELERGEQAYVVCPLIEPSDEINCLSAREVYGQLKRLGFNAALLHGRMKGEEKAAVMDDFRQGRTLILVSTTVIEVGVDVKNANIMVIENAERFGLAQLHQLRGRVGRGDKPARCFLVSDRDNERLSTLKACSDGFKIAEDDLKLRGAGEFLGMQQSGFSSLPMDKETIILARHVLDDIQCADEEAYIKLMRKSVLKRRGKGENLVLN